MLTITKERIGLEELRNNKDFFVELRIYIMTRKAIARAATFLITLLISIILVSFQVAASEETTPQDECVKCHTDATRLEKEFRNIPRSRKSKELSGIG